MNGRIPWSDIAENPSHHLEKRSRPDSDHRLEEPSHMKSDGVDTWLRHWLQLQKKKKRPLLLKDTADKADERETLPTVVSKRKGKRAGYVETDSDKESQSDQGADVGSDADDGATDKATHATKTNAQRTEDGGTATLLALPSPRSAAKSRSSRYAFLESLSENPNYKRLLSLLRVARVSFSICGNFRF